MVSARQTQERAGTIPLIDMVIELVRGYSQCDGYSIRRRVRCQAVLEGLYSSDMLKGQERREWRVL